MKILFIDPPGPAFGLSIGLGILSSVLKKEGHEVLVTDLNNRRTRKLDMLRYDIERFQPDVIGISIHATKYGAAREVAKFVRSLSGNPIMAGGPQVSADQERILDECPEVDFLVYGEAEVSITEIISRLENKSGMRDVNGVIYRENQKIVKNPPRELIRNISDLPFPNFAVFGVTRVKEYPVLTSRGCPYSCIFCFSHIGRTWRAREAGNVVEELRAARDKFSIQSFGVWDPVFNLTTKHVVNFCTQLMSSDLDLTWNCYSVRADRVDDEQARIMRESGCKRVFMGVETLDDEIMKRINKREKVDDIKRAVEIYHKHGLKVIGFFILGLPGDTFDKSIDVCEEGMRIGFDDQIWSHLTPYPGTSALEWVKKNGRILLDYRTAVTGSREVVFDTIDYSEQERAKAMNVVQWKLGHWYATVSLRYPRLLRLLLVLLGIVLYDLKNAWRQYLNLAKFLVTYARGQIKPSAAADPNNITFKDAL